LGDTKFWGILSFLSIYFGFLKISTKIIIFVVDFCILQYFNMKNLMIMIILNFERVMIKFKPYVLESL
jgi:hypothetical protein